MTSASFQRILDAALADYALQIGIDPTNHPFADQLQACHSPDDVLKLLEEKAGQFKDYREGNRKLINCLKPVVKVIHTLSSVLGDAIGLVSPTGSSCSQFHLLRPDSAPTSKGHLCWGRYSSRRTYPPSFSDYTSSCYMDATGSHRC